MNKRLLELIGQAQAFVDYMKTQEASAVDPQQEVAFIEEQRAFYRDVLGMLRDLEDEKRLVYIIGSVLDKNVFVLTGDEKEDIAKRIVQAIKKELLEGVE